MNNAEIKISVRNLVEFVLRSGDLDMRFTGSSRANEGTRIHQKLQKAYKKKYSQDVYEAEAMMKHSFEYKGFKFTVEGRADGIIKEIGGTMVDEIKSTTRHLDEIDEDYNELHWAQAKCYAYIHALQNQLQSISVQLTYYNLNNDEVKYLKKQYGIEELEDFFYELVDLYIVWANYTKKWAQERNASIASLNFPFETYRRGQREMAVEVFRAVRDGRRIFVQAPTGIGKTVSTLFPSIKAMGEGSTSKLFYLTAKTITRQVAEEAVLKMKSKGLRLKTVTLTAKDKICFNEGAACNPEECQYAKGHFDRVNEALMEILNNEDIMNRGNIEAYAEKHRVCPFEYALDIALWADCIICDYNYAFDPRVYLRRFFDNSSDKYAFLIDEAHNLVDRAREMFSAELAKKDFLDAKKIAGKKNQKVGKELTNVNSCMLKLRKMFEEECEGITLKNDNQGIMNTEVTELYNVLRRFTYAFEEWISNSDRNEVPEEMMELYFNTTNFLRISEFYDERYCTLLERDGSNLRVKLFCMDTSHLMSEAMKRAESAIFFSATLTPMDYFRDVLGGEEADKLMKLSSPFDEKNRQVVLVKNVSTTYRNRENSYGKIARHICDVTDQKTGNYMVFFPSYSYMLRVHEEFAELNGSAETIVQSPSMGEEEREEFLKKFKGNPDKSLIGFAVLGGIFSEGIDLKGDRLIGSMIVSVGLPQVCFEKEIIREHYDKKNDKGFEYSYVFPGMNKVLQAGGRVIRTNEDTGIIILVDERFAYSTYQRLLPREWIPYRVASNGKQLESIVSQFWKDVR